MHVQRRKYKQTYRKTHTYGDTFRFIVKDEYIYDSIRRESNRSILTKTQIDNFIYIDMHGNIENWKNKVYTYREREPYTGT